MHARLKTAVAVAACVLIASSALAQTFIPYHTLRQDHPSINAAVAAMPSSDLHGTLNRISALFDRSTVRDLGPGSGYPPATSQVPANFEHNMTMALDDLEADLANGFAELADQHQYAILQVVEMVAFTRTYELYQGCWVPPTYCGGKPDLILQLDTLLEDEIRVEMRDLLGYDELLNYWNFESKMDELREKYGEDPYNYETFQHPANIFP